MRSWMHLTLTFGLAGCGGYALTGKVVPGPLSMAAVVTDTDTRLNDRGVKGGRIVLYRDPTSLGRQKVGEFMADGDGGFTIQLSDFGAGWMDEQWLIRAERPGFARAESLVRLPSKPADRRLLVTLAPMSPGAGTTGVEITDPWHDDDLMGQYERYK
jgi:hypothetical protein